MAREPKYVEEMRKRAASLSNRELLDETMQALGYAEHRGGTDRRPAREAEVLSAELERRLGKWLEA